MKNNNISPGRMLDATLRSQVIGAAVAEDYDVLIIGGGITGAGIALDCASRGLRTALVEMQDFGAGTSSRSTKLIHGGLRYLKQFEFALVAEVGRERAILHQNAPHLVIPEDMLLPVVEGGTYGKLGVSFGLWFYDLLAGVKAEEQRVMLSKAETMAAEPLLREEGLEGAGLYSEYRTDDARLVIEVIKTAVREGAVCLNYVRAEELIYTDGRVAGAKVKDMLTENTMDLKALEVVNAAGPWVDEIRRMDGSLVGKRLHHTKGVHLVVPRERLPIRQSVYFDMPDGRMMFAIPRHKVTYLGTSDTNYNADPQVPWTTAEDTRYILDATNEMFPTAHLTFDDVRSTWAGIRPLIHEEGKDPSELSRKDEIFHSPSRLITIAGGKLTGFRKMAQRVSDLVMERLIERDAVNFRAECRTDEITLEGGALGNLSPEDWAKAKSEDLGVEEEWMQWLVYRYGSRSEEVLQLAPAKDADGILRGAIRYSIHHESTLKPSDFLIRRTGMLYFERDRIEKIFDLLREEMTELLGDGALEDIEWSREYEAVVRFRNAGKPSSEAHIG